MLYLNQYAKNNIPTYNQCKILEIFYSFGVKSEICVYFTLTNLKSALQLYVTGGYIVRCNAVIDN